MLLFFYYLFNFRFISQLSEPLNVGKSTKINNSLDTMKKLSTAFSAVAFQSYLVSAKEPDRNTADETKSIALLLSALVLCLKHFQLSDILAVSLTDNFLGHSSISFICNMLSVSDEDFLVADGLSLFRSSLLEKPLLDAFVIGVTLHLQSHTENVAHSYQNAVTSFRWFCIAKVTQIIIGELYCDSGSVDIIHFKKFRREHSDGSHKEDLTTFISSISKMIIARFGSNKITEEKTDDLFIDCVLSKWRSFIKSASVIMNAAFPNFMVEYNVGGAMFSSFVSTDSIAHLFGVSSLDSVETTVARVASTWFAFPESSLDEKLVSIVLASKTDRFSSQRKKCLLTLPDSYTKLHGDILTMSTYEYPAICLSCGAILKAGKNTLLCARFIEKINNKTQSFCFADGQGLCTKHGDSN